jgi:circadian clock protein KaiB
MRKEPRAQSVEDGQLRYRMTLFVAGDEVNSRTARANIRELCEAELPGRCALDVVDVFKDVSSAARHGIVVTPTLLVHEPGPSLRVIGNLRDRAKLQKVLGLGER